MTNRAGLRRRHRRHKARARRQRRYFGLAGGIFEQSQRARNFMASVPAWREVSFPADESMTAEEAAAWCAEF